MNAPDLLHRPILLCEAEYEQIEEAQQAVCNRVLRIAVWGGYAVLALGVAAWVAL